MSYFLSQEINEQRTGTTTVEVGEEELELKVTFHYHEWSEGHPYGDTTAYEQCSENSDEEYELDGQEIGYDALVAKLGDEAQKAIDRAIDNAN